MSDTSVATGHDLTVERWSDLAFREYVDKLVMKPYMGMGPEALVHIREDLMKDPGDALTFSLVNALSGAGRTGDNDMEGQEEALNLYGQRVVIDQVKNAIRDTGSMTRRRLPWDLKMEMTHALTTWMAQKVEDDIFASLASIGGTAYGSATEGAKDTWLAANSDRVLFGAATSNNGTTNDHSASLAVVDSSNDILKPAQVTLAKRLAQLADPKIRPIRIENGEEYFVMFVHPYCARDLKAESAWQNAQLYAAARGSSNPIFSGMLGIYDGVILKESPKCLLIDGVGAATIDVAANFLCGAQAIVMAQGGYDGSQRVVMTEKLFDYDEKQGVQIKSTYGVEKAEFNSIQHGVVTVYSAAVAD